MRKFVRRNFIIDPIQCRLLVADIIYLLTFCFAFAAVIFGPLVLNLQEGPSLSAETGEIADVFRYLDGRLLTVALVLFALVCLHSLILSHRIAGPLYRFRKVLEAAEQGDFSQVSIRKNDYLTREVQSINQMFRAINGKNATIRERSEEALGLLPRLQECAGLQQPLGYLIRWRALLALVERADGGVVEVLDVDQSHR